ncbi:hypothetical protein GCM10009528_03830 [Kineococcus aurantiacus]
MLTLATAAPADAAGTGVTRGARTLSAAADTVGATTGTTTTTTPVNLATTPSGVRIPGSYGKWKRVFADDFTSTLNSDNWSRYQGTPRGKENAEWRRENTFVKDGKLVLRTQYENGTWYSGGTSNARSGSMTYGKWLVRFRADAADGIGYVFLLYPQGGGWPPEVDFAEDSGGDRQEFMATTHWSPQNKQAHAWLKSDSTQWHTVGVTIEPGLIQYTIDGRVWATYTGEGVPNQPMWLGLQAHHSDCNPKYPGSCSNIASGATPVQSDIEVDWVARYTLAQ